MTQQKVMAKLLNARRRERRAATRLKLAFTTWDVCTRRVSYYSKRLAKAAG